MALMNEEIYEALKDAGASDEKARAAARSVASYDARMSQIERDLLVIKWMQGTTIALLIALVVRVFTH